MQRFDNLTKEAGGSEAINRGAESSDQQLANSGNSGQINPKSLGYDLTEAGGPSSQVPPAESCQSEKRSSAVGQSSCPTKIITEKIAQETCLNEPGTLIGSKRVHN